jgi:outer membrane protein assembly factor BamB
MLRASAICFAALSACASAGAKDSADSADSAAGGDSGTSAAVVTVLGGGGFGLAAMDPEDGAEDWEAAAGSVYSPLHTVDGALYALEQDEDFVTIAYDAATGDELFRAPGEADDLTPGPIVLGGRLITGWDDHAVAGVDPDSPAAPVWTAELPGQPAPQAGVIGTFYVVGDDAGYVTALDPADGSVAWQVAAGGPVSGGVVTTSDRVFLARLPATVLALDGATGAVIWSTDLGGGDVWGVVDVGAGAVAASTVGAEDNVVALTADAGEIQWRGSVLSYGADGGLRWSKHGLLVASGGMVSMLDAATGSESWSIFAGNAAISVPAIWGDEAYVSGYRSFSSIDVATGELRWMIDDDPTFGAGAAPCLMLDDGTSVNVSDGRPSSE